MLNARAFEWQSEIVRFFQGNNVDISEADLTKFYERYKHVIAGYENYDFRKDSEYRIQELGKTLYLSVKDKFVAYTVVTPSGKTVRNVKTDVPAFEPFILTMDSCNWDNDIYLLIKKIKKDVLAFALEAGHADYYGLKAMLLYAAKKGYVELAKRMTLQNEPLLRELLVDMGRAKYTLESWKKVIENIFVSEKQKNEMLLHCLRCCFCFYLYKTAEEKNEIIAILDYVIRSVPLNTSQLLDQSHLNSIMLRVCEAYADMYKQDGFDRQKCLDLIKLLIERDYPRDEMNLYSVYLRTQKDQSYFEVISKAPAIQLVHARRTNFAEFERLGLYYYDNPRAKEYLLKIENDYFGTRCFLDSKFCDFWKESQLRKKLQSEMRVPAKSPLREYSAVAASPVDKKSFTKDTL